MKSIDEQLFDMDLTCFPWVAREFDIKDMEDGTFHITARYDIAEMHKRNAREYEDYQIDLSKLYAKKYDKLTWGTTHHAKDGSYSIRTTVRKRSDAKPDHPMRELRHEFRAVRGC